MLMVGLTMGKGTLNWTMMTTDDFVEHFLVVMKFPGWKVSATSPKAV
jgi:hypothetical protein